MTGEEHSFLVFKARFGFGRPRGSCWFGEFLGGGGFSVLVWSYGAVGFGTRGLGIRCEVLLEKKRERFIRWTYRPACPDGAARFIARFET